MRASYLFAVFGLQAVHFVAAQSAGGAAAAPSGHRHHRCGCPNRHYMKDGGSAGGNPSTMATAYRHHCSDMDGAAPSGGPPPAPAAAAPTAAAAPAVVAASAAVATSPAAAAATSAAAAVATSPAAAATSAAAAVATSPAAAAASTAPAAAASAAASAAAGVSNAASGSGGVTANQLLAIMPSSGTCDSTSPAGQCVTAAQAAPLLSQSFSKYGLTNVGVEAAAIAIIAFESGEMKYDQHYTNGSPARTGQGTYNEMSASYVLQYAKALYGSAAPTDAVSAMDKINSSPGDSLGSAAWFIQSQCGASLIAQFATSPDSAWNTYITSCVGTTMTAARQAYWTKAKAALGV